MMPAGMAMVAAAAQEQESDLFIELMNSNQELPGLGASFHAVTAELTSWATVHHSGS